MKKTIFAHFSLMLLLASAVPTQGQYGFNTNADGSVYTFNTNVDGSINIDGYSGPPWIVTVPTNINARTITSIGGGAFYGLITLTNVTLPASVISIGENSFGETGLTNVVIPKNVTNIGLGAFIACSNLTNIIVETTNLFYESTDGVLFDKNQKMLIQFPCGRAGSYTIPGGVASIGDEAFDDSFNLSGIFIPNSLTNIGEAAFANCFSLTNVTIPDSVTSLGIALFEDCPRLNSVTISRNVTSIPLDAFAGCPSLTGVMIPESVTNIGQDAFYRCSVTTLTIPQSVTIIDIDAFFADSSLSSLYFEGNPPTVGSGAFAGDSNVIVYYFPGATGWSNTFSDSPSVPAILLNPLTPTNIVSFKPFAGLSYSPFWGNETPLNGNYPQYYPTLNQINYDITNSLVFIASEITTYGMDGTLSNIAGLCNAYGIKCYPCAYVSTGSLADTSYELNALIAVGNSNYPTTRGLVVGSESLLQGYPAQTLIDNINQVRAATGTNIPVGTRDVPDRLINNPTVVDASDFIMADIYAFWAGQSITNAVAWTLQQWQQLTNTFPGKKVIIGETGWPTGGSTEDVPAGIPGISSQEEFLREFVSMANSNNIEYFIFEHHDELWKVNENNTIGTVEQNWGIIDTNDIKKPSFVGYLQADFSMTLLSAKANNTQILVRTYEGDPYTLLGTTNLSATWRPVFDFVGASGTNQTVINVTNGNSSAAWFYRAVQNF